MRGSSDGDDVRQALAGDRDAFGRLYDRHAPRVRTIVAAVSSDWPAVEDLTQEAFLRAYHRLDRLRDPASFGAWISEIARRVARERRRKLRRDRHEFRAEFLERAGLEAGPSQVSERSEQLDALLSQLAALPERERLAVHAQYFHEQRADDAAAAIGVSRSGYYALLQRALDKLRRRLESPDRRTVGDQR